MNVGTKSVLFGVHQFLLHPLFVARAWWIVYREFPKLYEWAAIITHDVGYFGKPNMDGPEGEEHPEILARWWRRHFGAFGEKVAVEILGHSRFHAKKNNLPLSKLFRPDKLSTALYPHWLYLLLGNLSGEIHEYMGHCADDGKYAGSLVGEATQSQLHWLIEVQAHMALMGLHGDKYAPVAKQMGSKPNNGVNLEQTDRESLLDEKNLRRIADSIMKSAGLVDITKTDSKIILEFESGYVEEFTFEEWVDIATAPWG